MPDANTQLMQSIHTNCGAAIAAACHKSSVPPAFLAALVANESGGDANAKRFEKAVLANLWEVVQGRKAAYGSITRDGIVAYLAVPFPIVAAAPAPGVRAIILGALQQLDGLANSWGLTQVMGYEAIPFSIRASSLETPEVGLEVSLRMLGQFGTRFDLDLSKEFSELFDCWNTGRTHARTADPEYIPNGLARMEIYEHLATEPGVTDHGLGDLH